MTQTYDAYLDNGTRTRLTVGECIVACIFENTNINIENKKNTLNLC